MRTLLVQSLCVVTLTLCHHSHQSQSFHQSQSRSSHQLVNCRACRMVRHVVRVLLSLVRCELERAVSASLRAQHYQRVLEPTCVPPPVDSSHDASRSTHPTLRWRFCTQTIPGQSPSCTKYTFHSVCTCPSSVQMPPGVWAACAREAVDKVCVLQRAVGGVSGRRASGGQVNHPSLRCHRCHRCRCCRRCHHCSLALAVDTLVRECNPDPRALCVSEGASSTRP